MIAKVGDTLVMDGDHARTAVVLAVPHADGSPPYVVKWLATGHLAMVSPGAFSRIVPAAQPAGAGRAPLPQAGR